MLHTELNKAINVFTTFKDIFDTMNVDANFYNEVSDCFIIETNKRVNEVLKYCESFLFTLNTYTNETFTMFAQIIDENTHTHQIIIISVRDIARYYYPELETIKLCDE